jgi:L-seryl-tRNA(Ser) seleniumtransferase
MSDPRRTLPAVNAVLATPEVAGLVGEHPRGAVVDAVRAALARRRTAAEGPEGLAAEVAARLRPALRRVINATGVVVHTNLGRAPLAAAARRALLDAAGACTLEWDPTTGARASRHDLVQDHLRALTGAEAACVANTNAGAVLLALVALGGGGEVVVSRGQLVEIGGGFRVPDVLAASGCRLVEVGTTNRTRLADYADAVGPRTRALLVVHPSNFRVVGFTESVPLGDLARLARARGLVLVEDAGSGALGGDPAFGDEPRIAESVAAGADVVCFSADKLLGGPQAGCVVGTADAVSRVRGHPLMRALRPDKLTLAALEATLALHRDPAAARDAVPVLRMLTTPPEVLDARARRLAGLIGAEVVASEGRTGGGALPATPIPSRAVAAGPAALADALRRGDPPVAAVVRDGRTLLDVLTVADDEVDDLAACVRSAR